MKPWFRFETRTSKKADITRAASTSASAQHAAGVETNANHRRKGFVTFEDSLCSLILLVHKLPLDVKKVV